MTSQRPHMWRLWAIKQARALSQRQRTVAYRQDNRPPFAGCLNNRHLPIAKTAAPSCRLPKQQILAYRQDCGPLMITQTVKRGSLPAAYNRILQIKKKKTLASDRKYSRPQLIVKTLNPCRFRLLNQYTLADQQGNTALKVAKTLDPCIYSRKLNLCRFPRP